MLFTDEARGSFAKDPAVAKLKDTYYLYYSMASRRTENGRVTTGICCPCKSSGCCVIL